MTCTPRPDLLEDVLPGAVLATFAPGDLAELVVLQRCCWAQEAIDNQTLEIPALHDTQADVLAWATAWLTLVVRLDHRLVAAVRGRRAGPAWEIGRLMVAPDLAGRGIGSRLLGEIERLAPAEATTFVLFTGRRSRRNIATYTRAGYQLTDPADSVVQVPDDVAVLLTKPRRAG